MSKLFDLTRPLDSAVAVCDDGPASAVAASLAGCTFVDCLERTPLGEIWKVRDLDGHNRAAYYLRAGEGMGPDWRLERLQRFGHPTLPGFKVIETNPGRTVLLTDGCDKTLQERFEECRTEGRPGIPREELLGYLRPVAEALDAIYLENSFQHLGLNPRCLWLEQGRIRVGGFGLIHLLWLPTGRPVSQVNPRYCAPELAHSVSRACDQYSLGLIFAELLTGLHPLYGPTGQHRKPERSLRKLDLTLLSSADQEIIAQALRRRPSQRFRRCAALVEALEKVPVEPLADVGKLATTLPALIEAGQPMPVPPGLSLPCTSLSDFVASLVTLAAGPSFLENHQAIRYRLEPGRSLEHHCTVQLFSGAALLKLEGFRQQWQAQTLQPEPGLFVFTVHTSPSFWQRLTGRPMGLEIQVRLVASDQTRARQTQAAVVIRPFGCNRDQAARLLTDMGPVLLESIRTYLQARPEQRAQQRLAINQPVRVSPVRGDLQLAEPIECVAKDISARGIGLFLPHPLRTAHVYITLPDVPQVASVAGLAQIVRAQSCADGWYEVGAFFAADRPHR